MTVAIFFYEHCLPLSLPEQKKTKTKERNAIETRFPSSLAAKENATNSMRARILILLSHHCTVDLSRGSEVSLPINRATRDYTGSAALLSSSPHPLDHYFLCHPPLTFDRVD